MVDLVIIDKNTKEVVNRIVRPNGTNIWFAPVDFLVIENNQGKIGEIYNETEGTFSKSQKQIEEEQSAILAMSDLEIKTLELEKKRNKLQTVVDSLKSKGSLTIEEEGNLVVLENALENVMMKLGAS